MRDWPMPRISGAPPRKFLSSSSRACEAGRSAQEAQKLRLRHLHITIYRRFMLVNMIAWLQVPGGRFRVQFPASALDLLTGIMNRLHLARRFILLRIRWRRPSAKLRHISTPCSRRLRRTVRVACRETYAKSNVVVSAARSRSRIAEGQAPRSVSDQPNRARYGREIGYTMRLRFSRKKSSSTPYHRPVARPPRASTRRSKGKEGSEQGAGDQGSVPFRL